MGPSAKDVASNAHARNSRARFAAQRSGDERPLVVHSSLFRGCNIGIRGLYRIEGVLEFGA